MRRIVAAVAGMLAWMPVAGAAPPPYDPAPWLADLSQARAAVEAKYANLDWLRGERGIDLDALFARAATRVREAESADGAKRAFERLFERFHDGHVAIDWPGKAGGASGPPPGLCAAIGYDARQATAGTGVALPGYRALGGESIFPAGIVTVLGGPVGIVRVGVFQPQGYPALCEAAVAALHIDRAKPCDEDCADAVLEWAYAKLTTDFADRLRAVKAAGARTLLIDLAGNGGGSEWAEAAARMVTAQPLTSATMGFVRGPHWQKQWRDLGAMLRAAMPKAGPADRARLAGWAAEADAGLREATPCEGCKRMGRAGYATGLISTARAGSPGKAEWAAHVFSPAQYDYRDGVWSGPLVVLVDGETWSAAEEFTAMLQDNAAAIVMGGRTGGAGCGHTDGGTPTTLANSGGVLQLPDCVRYRRDGSNEVRGILPDVAVPIRADDGEAFRAKLIAATLPEAVARAGRLH